ncbi:MAG: hypothetical protein HUJ54_15100, partial [Erysipelotrichaceae bacterium]|nr:hypothetical protein [Erysipelotrichaceae bacterium]
YAEASRNSEQTGTVKKGSTVSFNETLSDQAGTVWKKTEDGSWVVFKTKDKACFEREKTENTASTKTEAPKTTVSANPVESSSSRSTSGKLVDFTAVTREKDNWDGVACAQMILAKHGTPYSQTELAKMTGTGSDSATDYVMLGDVITNHCTDKRRLVYFQNYCETSEVNAEVLNEMTSMFEKNINDNILSIVVIQWNGTPTYSVVYGSEGDFYKLYIPNSSGEYIEVSLTQLIKIMNAAGYFCWLA